MTEKPLDTEKLLENWFSDKQNMQDFKDWRAYLEKHDYAHMDYKTYGFAQSMCYTIKPKEKSCKPPTSLEWIKSGRPKELLEIHKPNKKTHVWLTKKQLKYAK